jgi:hypothetical protein
MHFGLGPEEAISFWLWVGRLWPIIFSAGCLFVLRTRVARPMAFLVLGSLVCFGVQWLVSQVSLLLPPSFPEGATLSEQLLRSVFAAFLQSTLLTSVFSLPPLWWLYRVLRPRPDLALQKKTIGKDVGAKKRRRRETLRRE